MDAAVDKHSLRELRRFRLAPSFIPSRAAIRPWRAVAGE